jgi:glycosyltransferase involved in cell wall biosynthesis
MSESYRAGVVLLAGKLWPEVGGMEAHGDNFRRYFAGQQEFPLRGTITFSEQGRQVLIDEHGRHEFPNIPQLLSTAEVVFYNSGHWITELEIHRRAAHGSCFCYRTGGNEILKADLPNPAPEKHTDRQNFWVRTLNASIDYLITNSVYTEDRLKKIGIHARFARFSGGVTQSVQRTRASRPDIRVFFCAARFVPYKNHQLLLETMVELLRAGERVELRLAGDGPLYEAIKTIAAYSDFPEAIVFLGRVNNEQVMAELAGADYYIQFSSDLPMPVSGGSYVHSEGMGRTILEAISTGTYVIALEAGAIPEVVTPDRGLLLREATAATLAKIIQPLLTKPTPRPTPPTHLGWSSVFEGYTKLWRHAP